MRRPLALLLALALASGCGSTIRKQTELTLSGQAPAGSTTGGAPSLSTTGLTGTTGTSGTLSGTTTGTTSPGTTGAIAPAGTSGTTTTGVIVPPGTTTAAAIPEKGRGWDKNYVYIGVNTQKDVAAVAQGINAKGLDAGDQEGQANAMVAEMNRRGGVFGRKVKVVFKDNGTVSTAGDPNSAGAAACTYFTQDHPVIALLNPVTLMDVPSFRACFAKAKVPVFSASVAAVDKKVGASLAPYFYQSVAPTWDALAPTLVARLRAQGWFGGWNTATGSPAATKAKVGVLAPSDDIGKRVGAVVIKALRASGAEAVDYYYADATNQGSAVLNFAGNGVTHVIAVNSDLVQFQTSASSQNYRPRYGITTLNAPVTFLEANSPQGQNNGAMGVGWAPSFDVNDSNDRYATPAEAECKAVMAKGGQSFSGKRLAEAVAFAFCDGIRLIVQAAAAGNGLTGPAIYQGVQKVNRGFRTAFSFSNGLGGDRLFIPGSARDIQWNAQCKCVRYTSATVSPF
jgi:ABC-type branched-subunit amino acid transport system substrate-binding protein